MYYFARTHNFGLTPHSIVQDSGRFPFQTNISFTNPGGVIQRLDKPYDIVYDSLGNAFVANAGKHHIVKIDPLLNITVFAGSPTSQTGSVDGTGTNAQFNSPVGLAIDPSDNLYVADQGNFRIRKITPAGVVTTIAGGQIGIVDGTGIAAGFHTLSGIAYDPISTDLFALDFRKVRRITQAGVVTTFTGSQYATLTNSGKELYSFSHIGQMFNVIDNRTLIFTGQPVEGSKGNVGRAYEISPSGVMTELTALNDAYTTFSNTYRKAAVIKTYYEIATPKYTLFGFNAARRFFQVNESDSDPDIIAGNDIYAIIDGQANQASFKDPKAVAFLDGPTTSNTDDTFFVTDDNTVRKIITWPIGTVTTLAGSPTGVGDLAGPGPTALFFNPTELAVNPVTGELYVCDTGNNKIKKVQPNGFVSNFIGSGVQGNIDSNFLTSDIDSPRDIVYHPNGKIYFWSKFCLKECNLTLSTVTTVAGDYYQPGSEDGVGINARFTQPEKMIINQDGDFLIFDTSYSPSGGFRRIRKITVSGFNVSTFVGFYPFNVVDGTNATTEIGYANGIAVDSTGQIFITDVGPLGGYVRKIDSLGNTTLFAGGDPSNNADGIGPAAGFSFPLRMRIDAADNLFLTDARTTIRQVDPAASVTTLTGSYGIEGTVNGPIGTAQYEQLYGIGLNPVNGDIMLSQTGYQYLSNPLIRLISAGVVSTIDTTDIGPVLVNAPQAAIYPNNIMTVPLGPDGLDVEHPSTAMCCFKAPANEPISQYDVVYLFQGTIRKMDQATAQVRPYLLGIARNSASTGQDVYLQYQGLVPYDDVPPFPFLDPYGTVFYAGAAGALTTTPPVSGYKAEIMRITNGINICPVFLGTSGIQFDLTVDVNNFQSGIWTFAVPPLTITVPKPWIQIIGGYANGNQTIWMDWTTYFETSWDGSILTIRWIGDTQLHIGQIQRLNFGRVTMSNFVVS